jgi:hypothetical protein
MEEFHIGELRNFYSSPDIIRHIKPKKMKLASMWHAWERKGNVQGFGGKERRKDTTQKTKAQMGEWDQNILLGD